MKIIKKIKMLNVCYALTLIGFTIVMIYVVYGLFAKRQFELSDNSDTVLAAISVSGVALLFLPALIKKMFGLYIPSLLETMYVIFIFSSMFLGSSLGFYERFAIWDVVLHFLSGLTAAAFGFSLAGKLSGKVNGTISPAFAAAFAFCLALSLGACWEIYEFVADCISPAMNTQKFMTYDGVVLSGHSALTDTMKDIIVDAVSSFIGAVFGYFSVKRQRGWAYDALKLNSSAAE